MTNRWTLGLLVLAVLTIAGSVALTAPCAGTHQPPGADCSGKLNDQNIAKVYENHTKVDLLVTFQVQNTGDCTVRVATLGNLGGDTDLDIQAETPGGRTQSHTLNVPRHIEGIPRGIDDLYAACIDPHHRKCEYDITVTGVTPAPKKEGKKEEK